jgi:hypothetical protein
MFKRASLYHTVNTHMEWLMYLLVSLRISTTEASFDPIVGEVDVYGIKMAGNDILFVQAKRVRVTASFFRWLHIIQLISTDGAQFTSSICPTISIRSASVNSYTTPVRSRH